MPDHILFTCPPEAGHLLPTIPIARRLKQKGYTITYFTSTEFDVIMKSHGFRVEPYAIEDSPGHLSGPLYSIGTTGRSVWSRILSGNIRIRGNFLQRRLSDLLDKLEPTVLVVDHLFPFAYGVRFDLIASRTSVVSLWTLLPEWGREIGHLHIPNIVLCPDVFELPQCRRDDNTVRYVEPSIDISRNEVPFDWTWLDKRKQLVLCSFGSQAGRYSELPRILNCIIDAARSLPFLQFIVASGMGTRERPTTIRVPANTKICEFVPQLELLAKSCVFVSHGGLGGIKEAIYMGVPSLVIPFGYDQPSNAARVQQLKLGESVFRDQLTASTFKSSILSIITSTIYSRNVHWMMNIFRERERNPEAAQFIHTLGQG